MTLSRRRFLQAAGGLLVAAPAASCSLSEVGGVTGVLLESELELPEPFRVPLPTPPVLAPSHQDETTDYYEIVQRVGQQEIVPGTTTRVWGYEGTFPGPTLVSRSGRRTVVRHRNELPVPTVAHLHGGRTPADSDGYPIDLVLPAGGGTARSYGHHADMVGDVRHGVRDYVYPLKQRAATLWYHDHRMDFTAPAVWRGLAGFHLVHDDEEEALGLPSGERDVALMICDRSFAADGSFRYPARDPSLTGEPGVTDEYMDGVLGDVTLVNGAPWPVLDVSASLYRFRILNASNARRMELALDRDDGEDEGENDAPFVQIGSDGGLLGAPVRHRSIPIAQAERFDVLLDFSAHSPGTEITMVDRLADGPTEQVLRFRVTGPGDGAAARVPERLADMAEFESLHEADATITRTFSFERAGERDGVEMWTVNGELFDPERMDADPVAGSTEIWELHSDPAHPIHLHVVPFKVLSREEEDPKPTDAGWKDTIDLVEGERARILVRFDAYPGRYVFHCHNLEHEDMAMMANFEIR
ncbi:FtsP/CotA-like multicopper oxidase with cupredoxin domain [Haloactinopolyspora alba]|uniref:Multicopper oxidase CueO n=1 Tax=Haloactinopolyspora alba TaxID=648780 RepID=A0A2P8E451_9ACTN|nr:multicopper oxidase domain-containing protein [Haloactinopolyspora alba]PSL04253.1 FtsP/CotA-like multicopper oxidase with cupredoxin domain [Haloactinopolyspora alba]